MFFFKYVKRYFRRGVTGPTQGPKLTNQKLKQVGKKDKVQENTDRKKIMAKLEKPRHLK